MSGQLNKKNAIVIRKCTQKSLSQFQSTIVTNMRDVQVCKNINQSQAIIGVNASESSTVVKSRNAVVNLTSFKINLMFNCNI